MPSTLPHYVLTDNDGNNESTKQNKNKGTKRMASSVPDEIIRDTNIETPTSLPGKTVKSTKATKRIEVSSPKVIPKKRR